MKSGSITMILEGALALSVVLSATFCVQSIFLTREFRSLNVQATQANLFRNAMNALATDCVEYSKKNPAIEPVLKAAGVEPQQRSK